MSLKRVSKEIRTLFLKEFTKELILNSAPEKIKQAEQEAKNKELEKKEKQKEKIISKFSPPPQANTAPFSAYKIRKTFPRKPILFSRENKRKIKYPKFFGLEVGKLFPLIRDPTIDLIECPGANKPIIIKKMNKGYVTKIRLNEDEINSIINSFSEESKIPVQEGIFRVFVRNLSFSAVVSDTIEPKFVITKQR